MNTESEASIDEVLEELDKENVRDIFPDETFLDHLAGFFSYMKTKGAETVADSYRMLKERKINPGVIKLWMEEGFLGSRETMINEILVDGIANGYPELKEDLRSEGYNHLSEDEKEELSRQMYQAYRDIKSIESGEMGSIEAYVRSISENLKGYAELLNTTEKEIFSINAPYNYLYQMGYESFESASEAARNGSLDEDVVTSWIEQGSLDELRMIDSGYLEDALRDGYGHLFYD